jgi:hypothetical protein
LLINPLMRPVLTLLIAVLFVCAQIRAQETAATPETSASDAVEATPLPEAEVNSPPLSQPAPARRSWMSRILHPFSSSGRGGAPAYKNPKLRGLVLAMQLSPQPVKLSEVRQIEVKATLTNKGKRAVELDFPTDQRIEIQLLNSAEAVLTKWSENHAIKDKPGTVLINPQEHIEYNEKITTRELTPDKVYIAEVFFPRYPEVRVRQKFMTAP